MPGIEHAPTRGWRRVLFITAFCSAVSSAGWLVAPLADFGVEPASGSVQHLAQWILHTDDHQGLPFVVVDKIQARVFVFSPSGQLLGAAPALPGLSMGDDGLAGTGERPLSDIAPHERITPAGRFVANLDVNAVGQALLWGDYEQAISLHPVRNANPDERRLDRLATPSTQDNRITYGGINVPARFWRTIVAPLFEGTQGIVYVLPDTHPLGLVFAVDSARDLD
jgi:hypothetical protein